MSGLRSEYLHLDPIKATELPAHQLLTSSQSGSSVDLDQFIQTFLNQGLEFAEVKFGDKTIFRSDGLKDHPPSTAKVEALVAHSPVFKSHPNEHWYARKSIHEDKDLDGTANFVTFDAGLRKDHSIHEGDYTPAVVDANRLLEWDLKGKVVGKYKDIEMNIYEMVHTTSPVTSKRIFNTLVVVAKDSDTSFVVVQSPVDTSTLPADFMKQHSHRSKHHGVVEGFYTSVERVKTTVAKDVPSVEWVTGTASDAAGHIPMFMQRMAFPEALTRDVGLFIKWTDKNRGKGT